MSLKNALLQPIEITASNNEFDLNTGAGLVSYNINTGVYANVFSVAEALDNELGGGFVHFDTDFKMVITAGTAVGTKEMNKFLGFRGTETGAPGVTATDRPRYAWIPTNWSSDTERWTKDPNDSFFGAMGRDGNLSGVTIENNVRSRDMAWPVEWAPNAFESAARDSWDDGSNINYPEAERCFEAIANAARTSAGTSSSTGNISSKGVYFIPYLYKYLGPSPDLAWPTWGDGGYRFDADNETHRDNYLFCSVPNPPADPASNRDDNAAYYNVSLRLSSATAPAWTTP